MAHEFSDGVEYHSELLIVLAFKGRDLARQRFHGERHTAKSYECCNDSDAHLDSLLAVQDCGGHDCTMLSECVRQVFPMLTTL